MLCSIILGCSGTGNEKSEISGSKDTVTVEHFNIVIVPDLSNRLNRQLYPKPILDEDIVCLLLSSYPVKVATYRRTDSQKDKIRVSFINQSQVNQYNISPSDMQIDLSVFEKQIDRIDYLKNRSEMTFTKDTTKFIASFESLTKRAQVEDFGADIWSYLAKLDEYWIHNEANTSSFNQRIYRHVYRNVLLLITDGYIEAGIYKNGGCPVDTKSCMFLSKRRIDEFRTAFKNSRHSDLKAFFNSSGYEITPVHNDHLKGLEVLVIELYDRSLAKGGVPTKYPTDLDILTLFWRKWLTDSNVSRFQLEPTFGSKEEAQETILNFLLTRHSAKELHTSK
jgi:hypothetical protein